MHVPPTPGAKDTTGQFRNQPCCLHIHLGYRIQVTWNRLDDIDRTNALPRGVATTKTAASQPSVSV
jgi:hypothetical protein